MFDLTKNVLLEGKELRAYRILRLGLYLLSLLAFFYTAFVIMFPTQSSVFSFLNPSASSNTIVRPRNSHGEAIRNGKIGAGDDLYFDASLIGNYSNAKITFTLSKKSEKPEFKSSQAVRSYQSFLYPDGSPLGFKDGTLLKNNHEYYIVSDGKLRKFQNNSLVNSLGFAEGAFIQADKNDLLYNYSGPAVTEENSFPDSSIFKISEDFYFLKSSKLQKFISSEAFSSQFRPEQALEKDASFLDKYEPVEDLVGFSDGSLISYADSVYVISEGKVFPIESSETFEAAGYSWDDVVPVSADQLSFYKKGKLFTLKDPHPSGTIFATIESGNLYIINQGKKNIFPTAHIAYSHLRRNPILVSEVASYSPIFCNKLSRDLLTLRGYYCEIAVSALKNTVGKDYEFKTSFENDVEFDNVRIKFEKTVTADNFRQSISEILSRIRNNYARQ